MVINRKVLVIVAATSVALFVISNPLGDSQHGLGRHNTFLADLGQTLFVTSLIGVMVFVALAVTSLLTHATRSWRAAHHTDVS